MSSASPHPQQQPPREQAKASKYRKPRVFVAGSTRRTLKGHHGMGQEPQGYAPKQGNQ